MYLFNTNLCQNSSQCHQNGTLLLASLEKVFHLQIGRHISFLSQTVFVNIFELIKMNILFSSDKVIQLLNIIPWEALKALGWCMAVVEIEVFPDLDPRSLPLSWCSVPFWPLKFAFLI